jgi:hypothetical protein
MLCDSTSACAWLPSSDDFASYRSKCPMKEYRENSWRLTSIRFNDSDSAVRCSCGTRGRTKALKFIFPKEQSSPVGIFPFLVSRFLESIPAALRSYGDDRAL